MREEDDEGTRWWLGTSCYVCAWNALQTFRKCPEILLHRCKFCRVNRVTGARQGIPVDVIKCYVLMEKSIGFLSGGVFREFRVFRGFPGVMFLLWHLVEVGDVQFIYFFKIWNREKKIYRTVIRAITPCAQIAQPTGGDLVSHRRRKLREKKKTMIKNKHKTGLLSGCCGFLASLHSTHF